MRSDRVGDRELPACEHDEQGFAQQDIGPVLPAGASGGWWWRFDEYSLTTTSIDDLPFDWVCPPPRYDADGWPTLQVDMHQVAVARHALAPAYGTTKKSATTPA